MKLIKVFFFSAILFSGSSAGAQNLLELVNPFIGTGGHGHTFPGATAPFGMIQISPDTRMADWDGSSGYHYSDSLIYGFSQTHLSGTGIPDYCDVLLMPFTGTPQFKPENYRSPFSHKNEKASPGYYSVLLNKHNIKAELTADVRAGIHKYTYNTKPKEGGVLLDLVHRDIVLASSIEKVSDYEIRGLRRSRSWAQDQWLYFYIRFNQPITRMVLMNDDKPAAFTDSVSGTHLRMALFFKPSKNVVEARVGISAVDAEGAEKNCQQEVGFRTFETVRSNVEEDWRAQLSKISIKGGTKDEQTVFYTALYHTMIAPNTFQDVDGRFRSTDGKIHKSSGFTNYSIFSLWDTYRALHPLMTILEPERTKDWINTFLHQYKVGGMLPVWELAGNETFCMIGYHSVPVIVDAYMKGIRGFDEKLALEAMQSYAWSNRFGLDQYKKQGFISNDHEHESVSKTLEYAYDDWCIAKFQESQLEDSLLHNIQFYIRAQNYKNVFDPSTGHMRGKTGAMWHSPFDPREVNNFYTEGNSWHYTFAVPQDIEGLIELYGGRDIFNKKLNELFSAPTQTTGRDQADITGLIGQYAHGNEPSHHMAYLYAWTSEYHKTSELINYICKNFYRNSPDGLIGNEDCGQMSAWYIFSAMGFYPVTPGSNEYVLGSPQFDEIVIHQDNRKDFRITSNKATINSSYFTNLRINNQPYSKRYISHENIVKGTTIDFTLGPSKIASLPDSSIVPHSSIDYPFSASPYIKAGKSIFKDSTIVELGGINPTFHYRFTKKGSEKVDMWNTYFIPIKIQESGDLDIIFSSWTGNKTLSHAFSRIPGGRSIRVMSEVHPMYTAGGEEALIDSVFGTTNWRAGQWQSYFGKDFEAVVEFDNPKELSFAGIHVLEEPGPWIFYPSEVSFLGSNDGKNFTPLGNVKGNTPTGLTPPQTKLMGTAVKGRYKFLKVIALTGGRLPSWHESAGQPTHLFIDEIIVK